MIGLRWLHDSPGCRRLIPLDARQLQTVMFLQLALGGHLLLFVVRTKRFVFEPPYPGPRLFWDQSLTLDRSNPGLLRRRGRPSHSTGNHRGGVGLLPCLDDRSRHSQGRLLAISTQRDRVISGQKSSLIA